MIGKLKDMTRSRDGQWVITFSTPENFSEQFDELMQHDVVIDIRKKGRRRSMDANAYCWALIGKISEKMNLPKNEVYRKEIIEHGCYKVHCVPSSDVEEICADWCSFGIGFQYEKFTSKVKDCTNVIFYKGSSYYDSKQMAKLIDGVIQDAEALGIPTITEKEAEKLKAGWGKKNDKVDHAV